MSEQPDEQQANPAGLAPQGVSDFTSLMAIMAPEEGGAAAGQSDPEAGAAAGAGGGAGATVPDPGSGPAPVSGDGAAAPADPGAGAADPGAGQPAAGDPAGAGGAAGDAGSDAGSGADATGGAAAAGDAPQGTAAPDTANLIPQLGELSTKFEEKINSEYQAKALEEVRTEHPKYFEALEKHPRLLVGQKVPSLTGEGDETLTTAEDAAQWQEALKTILVQEVMDRSARALDAESATLNAVHASIELFQKNPDLVPVGKAFDRELADRFAGLVKPYELRVDGKLYGYTIPVQPIIDQLRSQIVSERATKAQASPADPASGAPAAAAAASPSAAAAAPQQPDDQPQAGIQSKAGNSSSEEDFSALWGTLNLPNLRL